MFSRYFAGGLAGLLLCSQVAADAASHRQAAEAFYAVAEADDPRTVANVVTNMIAQLQPGLRQHEEILREFALEIVSSPEYADARVKVYQDLLSEEELRALTELFQRPVFQKYLELRVTIAKRNAEETVNLFRNEMSELARRINESAQGAEPAER